MGVSTRVFSQTHGKYGGGQEFFFEKYLPMNGPHDIIAEWAELMHILMSKKVAIVVSIQLLHPNT
jgi:hypothetical protein